MKKLIVLLTMLLLASCIKEDLSECPLKADVGVDEWDKNGQTTNN